MMSDALESLLLSNPGSEVTEQLVRVTAERAGVMMASKEATVRSGGLSITETLLSALKDNHLLQTKELPTILTLILETEDLDAKNTFKTAYKILLENLELYNEGKRQEIINKLTKNITKNNTDMSQEVFVKIFKNKVYVTLDLFRDIPNFDMQSVCEIINIEECFERAIYFIAVGNLELSDENLEVILNKIEDLDLKHKGRDVFVVEAVLKILEVYGSRLVSKNKEKTFNVIKNLISNLPARYIIHLQKHVKSCMRQYIQTKGDPRIIIMFKDWYQKHNIKNIVENINKDNIHKEYTTDIKALKIYIELMEIPSYVCDDVLNLNNTVLEIYMENGENYINLYKDYLSDMLYIALRYKTIEEIRQHILNSHEMCGLNYVKYFVEVYSVYFLKNLHVLYNLLANDMTPVCLMLNDILKSILKKKMDVEDSIKILELIDSAWPIYMTQSTFQDKHTLLVLTTRLPIQLSNDSAPIQWALTTIMEGRVEGGKLIGVLPGGDECR
ncbi:hypothetical protein ABMA27_012901 [Loxostege sticticalis]|uniref:Uncharacterized protein n=1 Tax=Loxostege sticticalis TaxID=481309 RepID=A0ABR3H0L3_LOXSC